MLDEHVPFLEAVFVEEQVDTLPGGEFTLGVLRVDAALTAAEPRRGACFLKLMDDVVHKIPFMAPSGGGDAMIERG